LRFIIPTDPAWRGSGGIPFLKNWEHKNELIEGFTRKYGCKKLVYYEYGQDVNGIIAKEKQIKKWNRKKKEFLVKTINPKWIDLSKEMFNFEN